MLNGSREGLFLAAIAASRWVKDRRGTPAILTPNPFYGAYEAGSMAAHCETVYLPATAGTGFLPDLDSLSDDLLARTVAFYLASPANPQGSVASPAYFARLIGARAAIRLSWCSATSATRKSTPRRRRPAFSRSAGPDYRNVVVFQSLSKRSNLPGLRIGFVAGDARFLAHFLDLPQRLLAAGADPGAAGGDHRLWRRDGMSRRTAASTG